MKNFEKVQSDLSTYMKSMVYTKIRTLENSGKSNEETIKERLIKNYLRQIENIEEIATIEIGYSTNKLIRVIQRAYKYYFDEYWQDFDNFMEKHIIGVTPDGKLLSGERFGTYECLLLGLGIEELSCFKGKDPLSDGTCNLFRSYINANYGTNIPMAGVEHQALNNYKEVAFRSDSEAKDKAFVKLREVQRDSGALKLGGEYHLLSTDKAYQEAKARTYGIRF